MTNEFTLKDRTNARKEIIAALAELELGIAGFEVVGVGVDGPILANSLGQTVVLKVIAKKELGAFNELLTEAEDKAKAAEERAKAKSAKVAKAKAKKAE